MKLRTYQAFTMAEALAAVKRDLGSDAVIINTRTFQRGGVLGIGRKTIIEVTATPAKSGRPMVETKPRPAGAAAAQRAYGGSKSTATSDANAVTDADRLRTRRLAQALAAKYDQQNAAPVSPPAPELSAAKRAPEPSSEGAGEPASATPVAVRSTDAKIITPVEQAAGPVTSTVTAPQSSSATQRFILSCDDMQSNGKSASSSAAKDEMQDELAAIKVMVGQVLQRQSRNTVTPSPTMPAKLFDMYLQLISQDISEELADTVVNEVRDALTSAQMNDQEQVRAAVLERLASHIPVAEQAVSTKPDDGRPLTIALIGPTGVGKTTTLAKLAATFKLRQQSKVGLITSDTYRIAAVDQLRTYANIIGLPLKVALTPAEMRQAVHALSECDVILIDTAGRGQNDSGKLQELREFLAAADPHEVHLVLSSTANEKVLLREAEAFSELGIDKIVLTKLDEAVSFGMLINVVRKVGKELSFLTTGQEVPTHIEIGRADRLADLILGGEVHA